MKKKLLSILLSACMLISISSMCGITAFAESINYINLSYEKARVGSTVEVKVIPGDNFFAACFIFAPEYDKSVMTLKSVECNIDGGNYLFNENADTPKFIWYNTENSLMLTTPNSPIFTLVFEISEEAADGDYPVSLTYNANDICDENGENIVLQMGAGQIHIFHNLVGDTNNDLSVSGADVVYLARYLVDMETEISEISADVNEDGSIDGRDLVKLSRFMVGMEIIPGIIF